MLILSSTRGDAASFPPWHLLARVGLSFTNHCDKRKNSAALVVGITYGFEAAGRFVHVPSKLVEYCNVPGGSQKTAA